MELRIKSIIWNIRSKKHLIRTRNNMNPSPNQDSVSSLCDNFRHSNIHITEMPEGEEKEQDIRNLFEKIMEKMP